MVTSMEPLALLRKFVNCSAMCKTGPVLGRAIENCGILETARIHPAGMSNTVVTMVEMAHDGSELEHLAVLEWVVWGCLINDMGLVQCHKVRQLPASCSDVAAAAVGPC